MAETLGKRIAFHRKKLGLTQDALAERLGVTAQAVSKWENDQSCPDIAMLPKLAELFDTTTDQLLGVERKEVKVAEVVTETQDSEDREHGIHLENLGYEFHWDSGRKSSIAFAAWVLLVAGLLLAMHFDREPPFFLLSLWELLWTTSLLVFGISGLISRFSMFRFACAFFGGYFLLELGGVLHYNMGMDLIFPLALLMFGIGMLLNAIRKPKKGSFHVTRNGHNIRRQDFTCEGDRFTCETTFGENEYPIRLPILSSGSADVSFGSMTVDLSGCEALAENCHVEANCSFGELTVLVPRRFRAELESSSAFGSVEQKGAPDPLADEVFTLACSANFGQITVRYL
ncbi:MAG: helix-turn-helix transcriptional regulator [Oscillospiraceae bacterium]|nr:helix-turn-helix transcriptional regulator [Oscillospiraceae bacterium]